MVVKPVDIRPGASGFRSQLRSLVICALFSNDLTSLCVPHFPPLQNKNDNSSFPVRRKDQISQHMQSPWGNARRAGTERHAWAGRASLALLPLRSSPAAVRPQQATFGS